MKVLMVGPYPPPYGGVAIVVRNLVNSNIKNKVNLKLLKTSPLKKGSISEHFWRFITDMHNLLTYFIEFKPDIVHIHTSYNWGWLKHVTYAIISKIFGYKVILHIHAYHVDCKNKFPDIWLKRLIFPPRLVFKIVDCIFTLSEKSTENIKKFSKKNIIMTMPNGIILEKFSNPISYRMYMDDPIKLLTVARLSDEKGLQYGIHAINKLLKKNKGLNLEYNIVGGGELEQQLKELVKGLNLDTIIHFYGQQNQDNVIKIMQNSHIFILPSISDEFPVALIEAQATGLPVISSHVGSVSQILVDGISGFLVPAKDVDMLAEKLCYLFNNPDIRREMGINGKRFVELNYDINKLNLPLIEIYKNLIKEDNI